MKSSSITSSLLAIAGLLIATSSIAQTWQIGYQTMTFVDPSRGNRQIETEIYYPSDVAGQGNDLGSPIDKKYPVVVFGHDQNVGWNHYEYFWNRMASQGFIVALPKTEAGATMDVVEYAKDMAFVVQQFGVMRFTFGSFFYRRLNGKSCVIGHGTGGSAAIFAVQYNPLITTLISIAAPETVPSTINAATLVTIPTVIMGGSYDCVAPIATNQQPMFDNIDTDCKTFVNFLNATHCHFAQNEGNCTALQSGCSQPATSWQNICGNSNYLLISFLRYYLKSNSPARAKFLWKLVNKQNVWTYIFDCNAVNGPRVAVESDESENTTEMAFYPNPIISGNSLNVSVSSEESTTATVTISNLMGQVCAKEEVPLSEAGEVVSISTTGLNKGYYMVTITNYEGRTTRPLIVQ